MDESRKQFEAEVLRRAEVSGYAHMDAVLNKTGDGGYATTWVDMMWEGWRASRAAIEIELPDELTIEDCIDKDIDVCRATHFNLGMGKLEQAIRAAGIKVKE